MIIDNKWFAFTGFRRGDLSGRPWGFLFIWKPRDYPMIWQPETKFDDITIPGRWRRDAPGRFCPRPSSGFRVGFHLEEYREVDQPRSLNTMGSEKYGYYETRTVPIPRFRFGSAA